VDNLTHSLFGAALARTPLARLSPLAAPILIAGSNLPDLDIAVRLWGGRAGYLEHHRGLTHGLAGVLAQALLLGLGAALVERRRARARGEAWRGPGGALLLALVALLGHPLLDLLNVYGLRPWLPFDGRWVYGDAVFILEPWLWLCLGVAVLLGGERRRVTAWIWSALLLAGAVLVALSLREGLVQVGPAALWGLGLCALLGARVLDLGHEHAGKLVAGAFAAALLHVALLFALGPRAAERGLEQARAALAPGEAVLAVTHAPAPLDPRRWTVTVQCERALVEVEVRLGGASGAARRVERGLDDARVRAALASPCAAAWRGFARFPVAALREGPRGTRVELYDARYQRESTLDGDAAGTWCSVVLEIQPDGAVLCP
jgi:inner membrane protein